MPFYNKFGDMITCEKRLKESNSRCIESEELYAVGQFRANYDYSIRCMFHLADFPCEQIATRLTQEILDGNCQELVFDYSQFSTQSDERKQIFTSSKGMTSEGRREIKE